jgi:hypothetical protein
MALSKPMTQADKDKDIVTSLMPTVRSQTLVDSDSLDALEALWAEAFGDEDTPGLPPVTGQERFAQIMSTMARGLQQAVADRDSVMRRRQHDQLQGVVEIRTKHDKRGRTAVVAVFDDGSSKILPPGEHTVTYVGSQPETVKVSTQDEVDAHDAELKARRITARKADHWEWRAQMARRVGLEAPSDERKILMEKADDFSRQAKDLRTALNPPKTPDRVEGATIDSSTDPAFFDDWSQERMQAFKGEYPEEWDALKEGHAVSVPDLPAETHPLPVSYVEKRRAMRMASS